MSKSEKSEDAGSSSASWKTGHYDDNSDMRMVVRHRDLAEIVASIKEYFDKAADAGEQVSEMLETGRAQLDRSFRQMKSKIFFHLYYQKFRIGQYLFRFFKLFLESDCRNCVSFKWGVE